MVVTLKSWKLIYRKAAIEKCHDLQRQFLRFGFMNLIKLKRIFCSGFYQDTFVSDGLLLLTICFNCSQTCSGVTDPMTPTKQTRVGGRTDLATRFSWFLWLQKNCRNWFQWGIIKLSNHKKTSLKVALVVNQEYHGGCGTTQLSSGKFIESALSHSWICASRMREELNNRACLSMELPWYSLNILK